MWWKTLKSDQPDLFSHTRTRTHTQDEELVLCYLWVSLCVQVQKKTMVWWRQCYKYTFNNPTLTFCLCSTSTPSLSLIQLLLPPCWSVQVGHPSRGPFSLTLQDRCTGPTSILLTSLSSTPGMQMRAQRDHIWSPSSAPVVKTHYARWTQISPFLSNF